VVAAGCVVAAAAITTQSKSAKVEAETTYAVNITGWYDLDGNGQRADTEPRVVLPFNPIKVYRTDGSEVAIDWKAASSNVERTSTLRLRLPAGDYRLVLGRVFSDEDSKAAICGQPGPGTSACAGLPSDASNPSGNRFTFTDASDPLKGGEATLHVAADVDRFDWGIAYSGRTKTVTGRFVRDVDKNAFVSAGDLGIAGHSLSLFSREFVQTFGTTDADGNYSITTTQGGAIAITTPPEGLVSPPSGGRGPGASRIAAPDWSGAWMLLEPDTGGTRSVAIVGNTDAPRLDPEVYADRVDDVNAVFSDTPYDHPLVTGTPWFDANSDGIRNPGEQTGLYSNYWNVMNRPSVFFELYSADGKLIWTTPAVKPGRYQLFAPGPCECTARLTTWANPKLTIAPTGQGTNPNRDSDFIETFKWAGEPRHQEASTSLQLLEYGRIFDIGLQPATGPNGTEAARTITGAAWLDDNANGVRDAGEAPAAGVRLAFRLLDERFNADKPKPVVATYTTGPDGAFAFTVHTGPSAFTDAVTMGWVTLDPASIPAGRKLSPSTTPIDWNIPNGADHSAIVPAWNESQPILPASAISGIGVGLAPA
jgi:hypothetical protein